MKRLLALTALLTIGYVQAQEVRWSELMKSNGRITSMLPAGGSNFYSTRWSGGALLGSLQLTRHENFLAAAQEKVANKAGGSVASINEVTIMNGEVVVFLTDKQDGQNRIFMQRYTRECIPRSDAEMLAEYTIPKGWGKGGYFNVLQSENEQFYCIEYSIPANKEDNERFGFKVLNRSFETVSEGEYESKYEARQSDIANRYLSNTGDYFIGVKVYNVNEKGKVKDYSSLEKFVLMHVTADGTEEVNLDLGSDRRILDVTFSSDNNRLMIFNGLYGDKKTFGVKGVFYFQLDFKKQQMLNEGFNEFGRDFITQDWSDKQKEKAEKREAKGKGDPALYNYDIRDNYTLPDGSLIGTIEQYYVVQHTTYNAQTRTYQTTYVYYYNDVILYRVNPDGSFAWLKKVPKRQVSTNDGGYLSSIAAYVTNDQQMVLLFNDNLKNYDESGNYAIPIGDFVNAASYRKKTNCVARVQVDLASGETERKTFFGRNEAEAIAIPKLFSVDYSNNEMLMVLRMGKKEKFGLISF